MRTEAEDRILETTYAQLLAEVARRTITPPRNPWFCSDEEYDAMDARPVSQEDEE